MVLIISIVTQTRDIQTAIETFRRHGGVMRTSQALLQGIHPAAFYRLVEDGQLTRLARGLYRLASTREFSNPDLAVVAAKAPDAVVCLISALSFHGITTQIPRVIHLAVPRGRYAGLRLRTPPVKMYRFDVPTFDQGIEVHRIDGVPLRIYGVARTLVDCFKYRNKLGLDVAIEALRFARDRKRISNREILQFARLLRQDRVMAPYLESVT
ncbi:MAG: type IV toxin-antitoxin system AbiEi family antitoxin domain-containing protein [Steroidobacteraceae bacterium]